MVPFRARRGSLHAGPPTGFPGFEKEIAPPAPAIRLECEGREDNIVMTTKRFSELGISPELLKAIDRLGFEQASPIQAAAIPVLLGGRDVVGQSQTGSGKTAAFAVPAIEKVNPAERAVQVLILCPTRELAIQVSEEVHKLALFKRGVQALPIYGGQSYERQFLGLKQGAQIVIGTPGRVMDHMRRGTLRLSQVRIAVLDEADVMLDMGFREDIEFILKDMPATRQTVFFSATMPRAIQELIQKYSRDPQSILIDQKIATVPTVEQVYYEVDRRYKIELLTRLIDLHDFKLGMVFCNTKRMVDDLVDHLNAQGYSADGLHGDMGQGMRDRVMNKFRKSGLEFLVATDVAARGIDVDDVEVVFNYDLPYDPEDYVHRIGRTGRAGRAGLAVSFVSGRELFQIQHIERFTRTRVHRAKPPTHAEVEEARASASLERVRVLLLSGEYPRQDRLIECLLEEGFNSTDISSALLHLLQGGEAPARVAPPEGARPEREPMRERRPVTLAERPGRPEAARGPARPYEAPRRQERPLAAPASAVPVRMPPPPLAPCRDARRAPCPSRSGRHHHHPGSRGGARPDPGSGGSRGHPSDPGRSARPHDAGPGNGGRPRSGTPAAASRSLRIRTGNATRDPPGVRRGEPGDGGAQAGRRGQEQPPDTRRTNPALHERGNRNGHRSRRCGRGHPRRDRVAGAGGGYGGRPGAPPLRQRPLSEHAKGIVAKLNRAQIKNIKLKVKLA